LRQSQQKRRTALDHKRKAMEERHRTQQHALVTRQARAASEIETKRREREGKGLSGFFRKVTGISSLIRIKHERQDKTRKVKDRDDMQTLKRRHHRELQDVKQQSRSLTSVEKREARSLHTKIKREQFRGIIHAHEQEREGPQLTPAQRTKLREFIATGREMSQEEAPAPSKTTSRSGRSGRQTDGPQVDLEQIKQTGQEIVRPPAEAQPTLTDSFAEALRRRVEEKKAAKERNKDRGGGRDFTP
jgi:delta 1-pyrroline-5-carboxylate dehydrogenase